MVEVNEPQVWTLIGVFAAALFAMMTLMSTMFLRVLRSELAAVRFEVLGEIKAVRSDLSAEIAAVRSDLGAKIDHLDRDVTAISRREFPDPPAA